MEITDTNKILLINRVNNDICLYGGGFRVFVIYKQDIVTHYVEADKPVKDESVDNVTYSLKLQEYKKRIKSIQGAQIKLMTLEELKLQLAVM